MGNLERLLERYSQSQQVQDILDGLRSEESSRLLMTGTVGAQVCFVLAAVFRSFNASHIFIASDKEEAAYIQNTLDQLLEDLSVFFFPDSFKRPALFEELDKNNVLIRTESVNKISNLEREKQVLVTYPEAIFEKVVDPRILSEQKISIVKDESLDVDTIIEVLVEYGFLRVDFVYEPGQFSVRGGIVDIFTYGNEWPYRIELFDDEVESIRTFNPTTQLSLKNIQRISIIPNINNRFTRDQKISVLNVFDHNSIVWVSEVDVLTDRVQLCFEKAEAFVSSLPNLEESELKKIFDERAFILPDQIVSELEPFNLILLNRSEKVIPTQRQLNFNASPQPHFNKNFKLLLDDLGKNERNGIETYLFTNNNRQIERFYSIFEDLNAKVDFHPVLKAIHLGFIDNDLGLACYTDHQIFDRFHRYQIRKGFTREQALNLKLLRELKPGDFVTHIDHGIGRYSGLEKIDINGHIQESVRLFYQNNDVLYVSINSLHKISKYVGREGSAPRLSKIGGEAWKTLKRKTKKKVKDIAKELIRLYAKRKASQGFAFPTDGYLQNELEASFIYEDTPDQYQATLDVKEDMMKPHPMDRLICGDVGFGKTEVAIRAAFKAVVAGKQAAVLVPTTILALQHYKTFSDRLRDFAVDVDYVNRFKSQRQKTEIYKKLESGQIDIIIGTHALLNKKVLFKDLGLLVIDEEQKFGVSAKEKLRKLAVNVDTLTLTATPIPRTLQFSLMAARDLSILRTAPPNRQPIHTERRVFNDNLIKEAIYYEINRGGQVFFVHNRVKSLPDITAMIRRLCPETDIAMAHGQMESKVLEKTLINFIEGQYDVLVCTNIIETGLDIPNANTIIINNAHQFGMSDLHQLRGRVGRSNKKAYCYLFAPPLSTLTPDARKRIKTLEEFSDLGSGFQIAMRDLDIRGAGNLLGAEQSGFISDIGYDTYHKILEEAVHELKETEFKDLFKDDLEKEKNYVRDVEVDADIEMLIPDDYINNIQERLNLYSAMGKIESERELLDFRAQMKDRFGPVPYEVEELFNGLRLRWFCKKLGFERVSLKNGTLKCYFLGNPQSSYFETPFFQNLLKYLTTKGYETKLGLKQTKRYLIVFKEGVKNLKESRIILQHILEEVDAVPEPAN